MCLPSAIALVVGLVIFTPPETTLADVERFPPAQHIRECVIFNREYQLWLERQILWANSGGRDWETNDWTVFWRRARLLRHAWLLTALGVEPVRR